ncbi:hypothetical protein ILUMI_15678, partial [Ignelater luminosus]
FELLTDHSPLTIIFGEKKNVPVAAAVRLQRWAILVLAYDYQIVYKKGADIPNADTLSRLPLLDDTELELASNCFSIQAPITAFLQNSEKIEKPITVEDVEQETEKDVVLKQVFAYVRDGWPSVISDENLKKYYIRKNQLTCEGKCVIWRQRVVIPFYLQKYILDLLYQRHQGIVRIKALAHSFVWWPTLDKQIEDQVKQCSSCQSQSSSGRVTPVYWPLTHRRWQRVYMDLAQIYYKGTAVNIFILIDAYSKWIEAIVMGTVTSPDIIAKVRSLVAAYGLIEEVVSENGPQFCSQLIEIFFEKNAIKHTLTPPYHANSNGAAERAVQNIKAAIKRSLQNQPSSFQNLQHIIDNEMFLGRRPRTRLSILQPNLAEHAKRFGCEVVNGFNIIVHVDYLKPRSTSELPQVDTNSNPAVKINSPNPQGSVVQSEDKTISDVQSEPPPQSNMQTTTSDVQPSPLPLTNSEPTKEPLRRSTR